MSEDDKIDAELWNVERNMLMLAIMLTVIVIIAGGLFL